LSSITVMSLFVSTLYVIHRTLNSLPTRRSSDLKPTESAPEDCASAIIRLMSSTVSAVFTFAPTGAGLPVGANVNTALTVEDIKRSEEHTTELQSLRHIVCRLLLEKKNKKKMNTWNIPTVFSCFPITQRLCPNRSFLLFRSALVHSI